MTSIAHIRNALSVDAAPVALDGPRHAGVAMVFCGSPNTPELCIIRRADRQGDRWSGHMALPGGRVSPGDRSLADTASRETHEEIGLDLGHTEALGALPALPIHYDMHADTVIAAFAYYAGTTQPVLEVDSREVAAVHWVPLSALWQPHRRTEVTMYGQNHPGIRWHDEIIWGLTLRVFGRFGELLQRPLSITS